ncbi:MAG: hypothetical protein RMM58_13930 [Chloroflexota bacterium]|nr:hypothetical protein [Dehalococcoidia bacterium]MDW8254971.1 hypothetical protein [Chloroflexota bacterium]
MATPTSPPKRSLLARRGAVPFTIGVATPRCARLATTFEVVRQPMEQRGDARCGVLDTFLA